MIMYITFLGYLPEQTDPEHAEDSYFWVCEGLPWEDGANTATHDGQGYDVLSQWGCVAMSSSNVGLAPKLSPELLDGNS